MKISHRFFILIVSACFLSIGGCKSTQAQEIPLQAEVIPDVKPVPTREEVSTYRNDMQRIEDYLNRINTLVSNFTQVDTDGVRSDGTFYLSRPGKLRWEYFPPSPVLIIAKGSLLTYYDKELDQVSYISLDESLSGFLTRQHISFASDDIKILRFEKENNRISVTIAQKKSEEEGELTLTFREDVIELLGMSVLDAIGKRTDITFTTVVYDKPLEDKLFVLTKAQRKKR